MTTDQSLQVRPEPPSYTLPEIKEQVQMIQKVMHEVMTEGEHWGKVPGCGDKPALLKPGAEKLCLTFRMAPKFEETLRDLGNGHREISIKCSLYNIANGLFLGEGLGSCSTMETKYRYRDDKRRCPQCSSDAIIKGKEEYGGGWICFFKKGGCGAKFKTGDKAIEDQKVGKIENPDIADTYNTVLKIAKKRAQVDAVISATAASDIFTQDIEEMGEVAAPTVAEATVVSAPSSKPTEKSKPVAEPKNGSNPLNSDSTSLAINSIRRGEGKRGGKMVEGWIGEDVAGIKFFTWDLKVGELLAICHIRGVKPIVMMKKTPNGMEVLSAVLPPEAETLSQAEQKQLFDFSVEKGIPWETFRSYIENTYQAIQLKDIRHEQYETIYSWLMTYDPKAQVLK